MPSQHEIQQQITSRILDGLKQGTVPWRKPWRPDKNAGAPVNIVSHRPYSGINPILLDLVAMSRGYSSRYWGTYQQWQALGAQVQKRRKDVKPGNWGTQIVFYRQVTKTDDEDGDKTTSFPVMKSYTVFNIDQVDGEKVDHLRATTDTDAAPLEPDFEPARNAIDATGAEIRFGGNQAFYARPVGEFPHHTDGDFIQMPHPSQFNAQQDFVSTSFHELVHWSEVRLGWKGSYALGELIAEIGACYLCAQTGVPCSDDLTNHVSYLQSWLKELERDPKAILRAASQASKATEYLLGFSRSDDPEAVELQAVS